MDTVSLWVKELSATAAQLLGKFVAYLPNLLGAVLLVLVGWFCARLLRALTRRILLNFNWLADRFFVTQIAARLTPSERVVRLTSDFVFWVVNLLFVTAATRMLGLQEFSEWLNKIVAYLPTLIAGALIIGVGLLASKFVRDLAIAFVARALPDQAQQVGTIVYGATMILALVIGLDQLGIDVTLLVAIIAIVIASALGGLALAFALGARVFIGNLLGAHYLRESYRLAQRLRIGAVEGRIEAFSPVSITLATDDGRATLPGKVFNEEIIILMNEEVPNARAD